MSDTYMDLLMSGRASIDDFPRYVEAWHEDENTTDEVFEYLGMSWPEYQLVCLDESRLRAVAAAKHFGIPIEAASPTNEDFALAARSEDSRELLALVAYLTEQGALRF